MAEEDSYAMKSEIAHMKEDILEIKNNTKAEMTEVKNSVKEMSKDILSMRDSNIETKIFLRLIQESQTNMAKDAKESQASMIKGIQEIKDEPIKNFKYYKMVGIAFAITSVLGTIFGVIKILAGMLAQ